MLLSKNRSFHFNIFQRNVNRTMSVHTTRLASMRIAWTHALACLAEEAQNALFKTTGRNAHARLVPRETLWYHVSLEYVNTTKIVAFMKPAIVLTEFVDRFARKTHALKPPFAKPKLTNRYADVRQDRKAILTRSALAEKHHYRVRNARWTLIVHRNTLVSNNVAWIHAWRTTYVLLIRNVEYWIRFHYVPSCVNVHLTQ